MIDAFIKTGNLEQRRHTLLRFLTHKTIIEDTKSVLQHVKFDKEATAGVHVLDSIKRILKNIFKSTNVGRITNHQYAWVNVLSFCLFCSPDSMDMTACMVGKQVGLSPGKIRHYSVRSLEKALLVTSGDKKGYELIEMDQDRTKYSEEEKVALEKWLLKDCEFVVKNPLKNDTIIKWD